MKSLLLSCLMLISLSTFAADHNINVVGCWYSPEQAAQHMQVKQDGSYNYHMPNGNTQTGHWELKGESLILTPASGPKVALPVQFRSIGYTVNVDAGFMVKGDDIKCD